MPAGRQTAPSECDSPLAPIERMSVPALRGARRCFCVRSSRTGTGEALHARIVHGRGARTVEQVDLGGTKVRYRVMAGRAASQARAPFTSVLSGELLMRLLARATAPSAADTAAFRIVMPASAPRYSVFMDCEAAPQELQR